MVSTPVRFKPHYLLILFAALCLAGCSAENSTDPVDPVAGGTTLSSDAIDGPGIGVGSGWFPLAVGNYWAYEGCFRAEVIPDDGDPESISISRTEDRVITGNETRSGNEYRLLENTIHEEGFGTTVQWERLRQTRSGLYQLDIPLTEPPLGVPLPLRAKIRGDGWDRLSAVIPEGERAAYRRAWMELRAKCALVSAARFAVVRTVGGAANDETVQLAYPLHAGATWVIREDPLFTARVERREVVTLATTREPAWRVRIDVPGFSPDDSAYLWYGATGFLGHTTHAVAVATNESGEPIGILIADDHLILTESNVGPPKRIH